MIEDFWTELSEGEIHVRDSLQFELKSEFLINPHLKKNIYKQEVFIFIPSTLQVNPQAYSKEQFYLDQTNLIRYKTPHMTFAELIDPNFSPSPLNRIQSLIEKPNIDELFPIISDELKLFAAIFRSTLRERVYAIVRMLQQTHHAQDTEKIQDALSQLNKEIIDVSLKFRQLYTSVKNTHPNQAQLHRHFRYVDEFMSNVIEEFLAVLLKQLHMNEKGQFPSERQISQLIMKEKMYRKKYHIGPKTSRGQISANESIIYRQGLLNRFVLEALRLKNYRFSLQEKHSHLLGALAAGVAMLIYMLLVWKITGFVINSFPIILLAVLLYIFKDRIKEGFKTLYSKQAYRWFPDYSTEISSPKGSRIGKLTESFSFIEPRQLPPGFLKIRNRQFHEELQALQRHETIIQYKREMSLNPPPTLLSRRKEVTVIFRLNVHHFLQKASNPLQPNVTVDINTHEITERLLPKVYHINLILRNTFFDVEGKQKIEIKTFRVVVDKEGIKRVEHILHQRNHGK